LITDKNHKALAAVYK
jgi:ATP-dependent 26S proteasome regulatory subunit